MEERMTTLISARLYSIVVLAATTFVMGAPSLGQLNAKEPQLVEIHARKFAYVPAEITFHKGQTYKLHLTSDDVPHSLRITALSFKAAMQPNEFNDVLFTPTQTGDFKADCGTYCGTGHKTMFLTIHVVE
jgi:cytochrome c oxidase subunit II